MERGAFILVLSILMMVISNSLIHSLSCNYSSSTILFYKSLIAFLTLILLHPSIKYWKKELLHASFWPNFLRAIVGSLGVLSFIYSVKCLPLADVSALSLTSSLFSAIGGYIFLKENKTTRKNISLILGFIGACIIIEPHFRENFILYLFPLFSSLCFASSALLARYLAVRNQEMVTSFFLFSVMLFIATPLGMGMPEQSGDLIILCGIGVLYALSQFLYVKSYVYAETSYLAPFKFLKVPFHLIAGLLFFQEIPCFQSLLGSIIITLSILFISKKY